MKQITYSLNTKVYALICEEEILLIDTKTDKMLVVIDSQTLKRLEALQEALKI